MKIKKVWFVSHYSMPPKYEQRIKTQMYAHYLGLEGIDCTIFSASTIHNTDIDLIEGNDLYIERQYGDLKFVHIKCIHYKRTDLKRIANIRQFGNRFFKVAQNFVPPDIIVTDTNCIGYKGIMEYGKKYHVPVYLDIRDLWPLSIIEYLNISKNNPVIRYLYNQEIKMYEQAAGIIFTMEGGSEYLKDRHLDEHIDKNKVHHINNGIDIDDFENNKKRFPYNDADLDDEKLFKIMYIGAIRAVNNLRVLCDAAKIIKDKIPSARFLVFGDGDQKQELIDYCNENGISNVEFKGVVEKKYIPSILSKGDINILNYQVTTVIKYGACQNKLFDYLASHRFTVCNAKGGYNLIDRYHCGIVTDEFTADSTAEAILKAYNMGETERNRIAEKAYEVAIKYDYKVLTQQLLQIISTGE